MAGRDFGGEMTLKLSTGVEFVLRQPPKVMKTDLEADAETNQDGSVDRVFTLTDREMAFEFRDDGQDIEAIQKGPRFNASLVEVQSGITHIWTDVFLKGRPSDARENGQVSGVSISGGRYQRKAVA
ncbi:MAG: hypothetical protein AAF903_12280 [Pseudomonadota bacterium]